MTSSTSPQKVRFDRFALDLASGELWRDDEPVDLPPQPARILTILVAEAGTLVERSVLRERIWGENWLDWEASLHQAIRRIRVALGDSATMPRFVETLPRRGYRFIAPLDTSPAQALPKPVTGSTQRASQPWRLVPRLLLAAVATLALVALPALVKRQSDASEIEHQVAPEALRLQREGLHFLSRGAVPEATERFRRAADEAPDWAAPWSALAEVELARPGGVDRARVAIERALARDADDARAWRLLGRLRLWEEWDWVGARGALDQAARIGPDDAEVWQLIAALETVLGREREALDAARRAMALDPISTGRYVDLGWTLYYLGRGEQALEECRRGLELEPESPWARQCVVQALLLLGRRHEASSLLEDADSTSDAEPVAAYFERQLALLAGDEETCASSAAAAIPRIVLGDRQGALDALMAGVDERRGWELPFARVDPLLASLREEPQFAQVEQALRATITSR